MSNLTLNINLEDNTFQEIVINQSQAQQICALVHRSFMALDPIYIKYVNQVQFIQFMKKYTRYSVLQSIRQNLAYGLRLKPSNKIVGAFIAWDVKTLRQIQDKAPNPSNQNQQKFWNLYNPFDQLQSIIMNLKGLQKGDAFYGTLLAIDPQFNNYHLGAICSIFLTRKIFDKGYKYAFSINYNPASTKLAVKFGGKIIATKKDQQQKREFCLIEYKSQIFEFLDIYIKMNKQKTLKQVAKKQKIQTPKSKL